MEIRNFDAYSPLHKSGHTSKGDQLKWKIDDRWYKADYMGYEGLSEVLVSDLLQKSTCPFPFVEYEAAVIEYNGKIFQGCSSLDFLKANQVLIPLEKLYRRYTGESLAVKLSDFADVSERIQYLVTQVEEITKIDKDNQSTSPNGEGSLIGTVYSLLDKNNTEIATITINENSIGKLENIPFGIYYLQEKHPGEGYHLDTKKYKLEITDKNPKIYITLENEIIKKKIIIYKTYGENNKIPEANITFAIYNNENKKVATITTDKNGKAEIILPYGNYKIVQENTTDGYHKVNDIEITITDTKDEIFNLVDYKIKVPNTKTNFFAYLIILSLIHI